MGQCVSGQRPRRPETCWISSPQPFNQDDLLKTQGAIITPLPTGPTLEVEAYPGDDGYGSESGESCATTPSTPIICSTTTASAPKSCITTSKPERRVTFNPQVQVRRFERETHERIRLVIIPDSDDYESDSLKSPVPPRSVRVARRKPRESVVKFRWDDVLAEVYRKPQVATPMHSVTV